MISGQIYTGERKQSVNFHQQSEINYFNLEAGTNKAQQIFITRQLDQGTWLNKKKKSAKAGGDWKILRSCDI